MAMDSNRAPTTAQVEITDLDLTNRYQDKERILETNDTSKQDAKAQNTAWNQLRGLIESLQTITRLPSLSSAVGLLLSYLDRLEVEMEARDDSDDLATELATLCLSLKQHLDGASPILESDCSKSITMTIELHVKNMKDVIDHAPEEELADGVERKEALVGHYRLLQQLFQRLLVNMRMSTWGVANEHLANTRLDGLHPAKQAAFDSSLSTEVNRRKCTEGTRIRVLTGLDDWLYDPSSRSIYWMNGMAGTGKTTIASTFCEGVERRKILAASFFCTRSSAGCRNVWRIIPTIAYQLARYSMPYQAALCEMLEQNPDIGSQTLSKQFEQLLKSPLQRIKDTLPDRLLIVVDALDECNDRNGVELLLNVLFRYASQIPLRFLVTSRPEPEIYTKVSVHSQSRQLLQLHDLERSLVRADIELYLTKELEPMSPSPTELRTLAERSGILFIYAATLVRYIYPGNRSVDPQKRLQSLLIMNTRATKQHTHIDALYTAVLTSALSEENFEADVIDIANVVLHTALTAQEPISVQTIARLSQIGDPQHAEHIVHALGSVLHRSEVTGLVSALHASFPDFVFDEERSGPYFCDIARRGQLLAQGCFLAMEQQLRFNICDLESSFVADCQVDDLQERIDQSICPTLTYACRYWGSHLRSASKSDALLKAVKEFVCDRLLFWMEVLSLKGELVAGVETLLKANQWLNQAGPALSDLVVLVEDARNYLTGFASSPASQSTPHIYISALPFCPRSSSVYKNYWKRTHRLLELKGSLMERREGAALATWNIGSDVYSVAYSPDGTRVAAGCGDGTIRILSAHDGMPLVDPLQGHSKKVSSVTFSPDGKLVASGSYDDTIRVWNAYNGAPVSGPFAEGGEGINSITFSPDGTRILSGSSDSKIRIWNINDGTLFQGPFEGHASYVRSVAFSPDGVLIASGSSDNTVRLWNSRNGAPTASPLEGHTLSVMSVSFTPDGTRLVSGSFDQTVRVWNVFDGSAVDSSFEGHKDRVLSVAISPDGSRIVSSSGDRTVRVWNINNGTLVAGPFVGHTHEISSVAYSPDGTRAISGSVDGIRAWNVRDGLLDLPFPFQERMFEIKSIILSANGTRFLSDTSRYGTWVWETGHEEVISKPLDGPYTRIHFPSGSCSSGLVTASAEDHSIYIMDVNDLSQVAGPLKGHTAPTTSVGFSSDNSTLVTGSDDFTVRVWDSKKEEPIAPPFRGHAGQVSSVAVSSDRSRVVSCSSQDKTIRVWDTCGTITYTSSSSEFVPSSQPDRSHSNTLEEWTIRENGWVVNGNSDLLFWIPHDLAQNHAWPSPHAEFIICMEGVLYIPKQEPLIGDQWSRCYITD